MIDRGQNILVSVIMPIYNSQQYLRDAISSVLNQTYPNFELLLIDDGSSDESPAICDGFAKKDKRIHVIHKRNAGVCNARNQGIDLARGKYICFIDNDDIYDSLYLEIMVDSLKHGAFDLIKCGRRNIRITPELVEIKKAEFGFDESRSYTIKEFIHDYYIIKKNGCFNSIWNGMYSADFLRKNGIRFDENIRHGNEDLIFNYTVLEYESKIYVVRDILYTHYYRISHSTSTKYYPDQVDTRIEAIEIEKRLLDKYGCNQYRAMIDFEQMRECLRIISQCEDAKERRRETIKVYEKLDMKRKLEKRIAGKLRPSQKVDWLLFKYQWFDLYFLYKKIQRRVES